MREAVDVALAILWRVRGGVPEVLVAQRDPEAHLGGMFEFPGGKVEPGESPRQAAARELCEETGIDIPEAGFDHLLDVEHDYGDRLVRLSAWIGPAPAILKRREGSWERIDAIQSLPFPAANDAIVAELITDLESKTTGPSR